MVPKKGWSCRARRRAATRSSTSSASTSRLRNDSGTSPVVAVPCPCSSAINLSDHLVDARDALARRPPLQLPQHPVWRPRIGERGGADLHGAGAREQQLG